MRSTSLAAVGTTVGSSCVPAEVAAWVLAGRAALAVGDRADEWDASVRRAVLSELDRVEAMAASLRAKVVTSERNAGTWSLRGDRDLAGFLGRESHQGRGAGFSVVGQAATLTAMPAVADALVDGPVTPKHVQEITRATAASPTLAASLATPAGQAQVVEMARRLDGAEFGRQLKAMSAALDPASRQREHDVQRANRFLAISHTSGGTLIKGALDSVAGYKFAKMIDAFTPRPAADDERSREQRQADALMVAVDRALADTKTTPGAHAPVEALITMTQETWAALRAMTTQLEGANESEEAGVTSGARPGRGSAGDLAGRLTGVEPVVDETGRAWPASEIARALCDCQLTRAVVGASGEVLDLGRDERLFQRQHWRALFAMGIRTCAVPGCGMPLRYTELHHIAWWDRDDGPSSLTNCAPYCSFHHHEIHRLDIRITRHQGGTFEHRHPDGRPYGGAPPGGSPAAEPRGDTAAPLPGSERGAVSGIGAVASEVGTHPPVARVSDAVGDVRVRPFAATRPAPHPSAGVPGPDSPPDDLLSLLPA
jgi:hypothetical protein